MLLEKHHWNYPALNATDVDDLIPYLVYYPEWQKRRENPAGGAAETRREVKADQVSFF